nr:capsid protein [Rat picobirnavirus]
MSKNNNKQTDRKDSRTQNYQNGKAQKAAKQWNKGSNMRGKQGSKDSKDRRVNYDNARIDKVEKDIEEGKVAPSANSITDFNKNAELLRSAGSIPFASILGDPINYQGNAGVPGIMTIAWTPNYGSGLSPVALNQCKDAMYSYLTHANSRDYKYTAADLMTQVLGGTEVFAAISEAERAYGIARNTTEENRYTYSRLLEALGFDADDIRKNLGQMWFDINDLITQSRQIWIPKDIPLVSRWFEKGQYVYTDATGPRSQIYMFKRSQFFEYNELNFTTGSGLIPARYWYGSSSDDVWDPSSMAPTDDIVGGDNWSPYTNLDSTANGYHNLPVAVTTTKYTWQQFKSMIQNMINKLVNSEDRGIIYGDILNAYGASNIYAMPTFSADHKVEPVYNAEILMQIENLNVVPLFYQAVVQTENGTISGVPYLSAPNSANVYGFPVANGTANGKSAIACSVPDTQILNMHIPGQPSPENIMLATRMKSSSFVRQKVMAITPKTSSSGPKAYEPGFGGSLQAYMPKYMGTEVPVVVSLWRAAETTTNKGRVTYGMRNQNLFQFNALDAYPYTYDDEDNTSIGLWAMELMAFDWHPFIYNISQNFATGLNSSCAHMQDAFGDFDNYITITDVELMKLHNTAMMSVFGVPLL